MVQVTKLMSDTVGHSQILKLKLVIDAHWGYPPNSFRLLGTTLASEE